MGQEAKSIGAGPHVCDSCAKGFYKQVEGVGSCAPCPVNFTTTEEGAEDCNIRKYKEIVL